MKVMVIVKATKESAPSLAGDARGSPSRFSTRGAPTTDALGHHAEQAAAADPLRGRLSCMALAGFRRVAVAVYS